MVVCDAQMRLARSGRFAASGAEDCEMRIASRLHVGRARDDDSRRLPGRKRHPRRGATADQGPAPRAAGCGAQDERLEAMAQMAEGCEIDEIGGIRAICAVFVLGGKVTRAARKREAGGKWGMPAFFGASPCA